MDFPDKTIYSNKNLFCKLYPHYELLIYWIRRSEDKSSQGKFNGSQLNFWGGVKLSSLADFGKTVQW